MDIFSKLEKSQDLENLELRVFQSLSSLCSKNFVWLQKREILISWLSGSSKIQYLASKLLEIRYSISM